MTMRQEVEVLVEVDGQRRSQQHGRRDHHDHFIQPVTAATAHHPHGDHPG